MPRGVGVEGGGGGRIGKLPIKFDERNMIHLLKETIGTTWKQLNIDCHDDLRWKYGVSRPQGTGGGDRGVKIIYLLC